MKTTFARLAVIISCVLLVDFVDARLLWAAPITGGTGPGGIGTTDGTSSLKLWLVGDTLSAGSVASWTDSSGAGHTATEATNQPTATTGALNGHTVVDFSAASSTRLATADHADFNVQDLSVFAVASHSTTDWEGIVTKHSTNSWADGWGLNFDSGSGNAQLWTTSPQSNAESISGGYHVIDGSVIAADSNRRRLLVDGTGGAGSTGSAIASTSTPVRIGHDAVDGSNNPGYYLTGSIAEVIFTNASLNAAQRIVVENYLSSKYDIALVAGDHYAGDTALAGDYDRDVFGVGRVNASNQFVNTGAMGLGIEADTLTLDDNEWIFAGHNAPINGITAGQWDRDWYIDVEGSVGATLSFDFSDGDLAFSSTYAFSLLYKSPSDTAFTALSVSQVVVGDTVSFDVPAAMLLDGYFTLSAVAVPEPSTLVLAAIFSLTGLCARRASRRKGRRG